MSEELTLLPCPACKRHSAGITRTNGTGVAFVMCRRIGCALSGPIRKTDEAAVAAWNALPRALEWTDEPPKVDLWYWHRIKDRPESASIVKVWPPLLEEPHLGENHQWAGPIPEPREPKE